jgi:hypothetical protein
MADPASLILAIASLVGIALTFVLNMFQSCKSGHCESKCGLLSCLFGGSDDDNVDDDGNQNKKQKKEKK